MFGISNYEFLNSETKTSHYTGAVRNTCSATAAYPASNILHNQQNRVTTNLQVSEQFTF